MLTIVNDPLQHSSMDRLSPAPFQNGTDCQLLQLMQYFQHRSTRNWMHYRSTSGRVVCRRRRLSILCAIRRWPSFDSRQQSTNKTRQEYRKQIKGKKISMYVDRQSDGWRHRRNYMTRHNDGWLFARLREIIRSAWSTKQKNEIYLRYCVYVHSDDWW